MTRVRLEHRARKAPPPQPPANRHTRRAPLDGQAVMAALARIEQALADLHTKVDRAATAR
jgi:hypothetical protein